LAKKKTTAQLKKDLWVLCGKLNRKFNPPVCYTCGATGLSGSNWHPGHGKPKGELNMRYKFDMRNIRSQCINCNINYGGKSDIFITKLEKEKEGLEFLEETCYKENGYWKLKSLPLMGGVEAWGFVTNKIAEYKELLK